MSMMTRLLIGLTVLGGMFSFLGGRDYWHASKAGVTPEILTAAQLLARGADGNPFVEVSGFVTGENFVYEEEHGKWQKVWMPFSPAEESATPTSSVKAVLKSNRVHSEFDLAGEFDNPTVRGMIMNHVESLGKEEQKILTSSYPGTEASSILILDVTKDPVAMKKQGAMFFGIGILSLFGAGVVGFFKFVRK